MQYARILLFLVLFPLASLLSAYAQEGAGCGAELDYKRLQGKWYEIAHLPNARSKGLGNVTTTFRLAERGKIEVTIRAQRNDGRGRSVYYRGLAQLPESGEKNLLKVRFFGIVSHKFHILEFDAKNYDYALLCDDSKKDLWILSRRPTMDKDVYSRLVQKAQSGGFNIAALELTPQDRVLVNR
jgi:apolipoprotein D and lipocalin family protein